MKLVWSPEMASQAYIDTVKACKLNNESSVAELISAMAAGWNAKLIVETWSTGGAVATSIGLAVARRYTGGRHVCIVSDEESRAEYTAAIAESGMSPPEVVVGEVEEVMGGLEGIDFMVVDCMVSDFEKGFRVAKLGQRGAVLIGKNACSSRVSPDFRWRCVLDGKSRIVRSVLLPVGKGLDIAHVGASYENSGFTGKLKRRWIKHVDRRSGRNTSSECEHDTIKYQRLFLQNQGSIIVTCTHRLHDSSLIPIEIPHACGKDGARNQS